MNLFELQERLKDFSQDQLVREMQAPTGTAPQYLVLSELQRRQRMMAQEQAQMPQDQTTVAQDALAAAGMPQGGLADMAQAMAPRTDMDMNTGVAPVPQMRDGGVVRMNQGGLGEVSEDIRDFLPDRMMEQADARRRRAELAAAFAMPPATRRLPQTREDQLFSFDENPLVPRASGPTDIAPPEGTDLRGLGTLIGDTLSGTDPSAEADSLLEQGLINQDQYNRYVFGSRGERERIIRESLGYVDERPEPETIGVPGTTDDPFPLPELIVEQEDEISRLMRESADQIAADRAAAGITDASDSFGALFAGGDEEGAAAVIERARDLNRERFGETTSPPPPDKTPPAPRATPPAGGAPSVDDAFEQDKWLALAQAGLALMSSQQPTLGGAIGEAGLTGISALRTARGERDDRIEKAQARADRLAAAASRGTQYPYRQARDLLSLADAYDGISEAILAANSNVMPSQNDPSFRDYHINRILAEQIRADVAKMALGTGMTQGSEDED